MQLSAALLVALAVASTAIHGHPTASANIGAAGISAAAAIPKVKLSLYFESLCPYCKMFITRQLGPNFAKFEKYLDVELNSFGNARMSKGDDGQWKFTCQHGSQECRGSIIEACLIAKLMEAGISPVPVITCMESSNPTLLSTAQKCMSSSGIGPNDKPSVDEIISCSKGNEGKEIFAKFGKETPKHSGVPWVTFNDHFDDLLWTEALTDLPQTLCEHFLSDVPECQ